MEFNKRKLSLKIDGVGYSISYPSVNQLKKHQGNFKDIGDDAVKSIEAVQMFLDDLGLPEKISGELEPSALTEIVNEVSGVTKK